MTTWYGTYRGKKGRVGYFVAREEASVPPDAIQVIASDEPACVCQEKAQAMRAELEDREAAPPARDPGLEDVAPGRVCVHNDGKREHVSVVLSIDGRRATALFFTGTPEWANGFRGRRATNEELAMVSYKQTKAATYLVKVVRDVADFQSVLLDVPEHWVDGWLEEFGAS